MTSQILRDFSPHLCCAYICPHTLHLICLWISLLLCLTPREVSLQPSRPKCSQSWDTAVSPPRTLPAAVRPRPVLKQERGRAAGTGQRLSPPAVPGRSLKRGSHDKGSVEIRPELLWEQGSWTLWSLYSPASQGGLQVLRSAGFSCLKYGGF